ncbi:MAG: hypothetical protein BWY11_02457 [Firmicutes bacterium ADurb.Bin182]|nr:MAG: hypothetical protein BWY11_02457 [Firmicutes bacterium ADurb.Bin182]
MLDPAYTMSLKQAKVQLAITGYQSFAEMIMSAKARSSLPEEVWAEVDMLIEHVRRKDQRQKKIIWTLQRHRRLALACLCILLIIGFFVFIPSGRTIARKLYNMIVRMSENRVIIEDEYGTGPRIEFEGDAVAPKIPHSPEPSKSDRIKFNSLEEFVAATGFNPIIYDPAFAQIESITAMPDGSQGYTVDMVYSTMDGGHYAIIHQIWLNGAPSDVSIYTQDGEHFEKKILSDTTIFCTIDHSDNTFSGIAWFRNTEIIISAEQADDYENLLNSLRRYED